VTIALVLHPKSVLVRGHSAGTVGGAIAFDVRGDTVTRQCPVAELFGTKHPRCRFTHGRTQVSVL